MGTGVPSDIILDIEDGVLNVVAIGEKFSTEIHVRLCLMAFTKVSRKYLDEGEETSVIAADILDVGVSHEQLI